MLKEGLEEVISVVVYVEETSCLAIAASLFVEVCSSISGRPGGNEASFLSLPDDGTELRKKWIVNIGRDVGSTFSVNTHTKMCSLHFTADCFHSGEHRRVDSKKATTQKRKRLCPDAVPTVFSFRPEPKKKESSGGEDSSTSQTKKPT